MYAVLLFYCKQFDERGTTLHLNFGATRTVPGVSSLGSHDGSFPLVGGKSSCFCNSVVTNKNVLLNVVLMPIHARGPTPNGMKNLKVRNVCVLLSVFKNAFSYLLDNLGCISNLKVDF